MKTGIFSIKFLIFCTLFLFMFLGQKVEADIAGNVVSNGYCSVQMYGINHNQKYSPGDTIDFSFRSVCEAMNPYNPVPKYPKKPCRCVSSEISYGGDTECDAYFWEPPDYHAPAYTGDPWDTYPPNGGCVDKDYDKKCDIWERDDGHQCECDGANTCAMENSPGLTACGVTLRLTYASGEYLYGGSYTISSYIPGKFRYLSGGRMECVLTGDKAKFKIPSGLNEEYTAAAAYLVWGGQEEVEVEYVQEIEAYSDWSDRAYYSRVKKVKSVYDPYSHAINFGSFGEHIKINLCSCNRSREKMRLNSGATAGCIGNKNSCGSSCSCTSSCRKVVNKCSKNVFIPLKTAAEWNNFISSHPSCIDVKACN